MEHLTAQDLATSDRSYKSSKDTHQKLTKIGPHIIDQNENVQDKKKRFIFHCSQDNEMCKNNSNYREEASRSHCLK